MKNFLLLKAIHRKPGEIAFAVFVLPAADDIAELVVPKRGVVNILAYVIIVFLVSIGAGQADVLNIEQIKFGRLAGGVG